MIRHCNSQSRSRYVHVISITIMSIAATTDYKTRFYQLPLLHFYRKKKILLPPLLLFFQLINNRLMNIQSHCWTSLNAGGVGRRPTGACALPYVARWQRLSCWMIHRCKLGEQSLAFVNFSFSLSAFQSIPSVTSSYFFEFSFIFSSPRL